MTSAAFARFLVHDVDLLTPTYVVGRYGDSTPDWASPPAATLAAKGWFTRVDTDELADGREAITDTYELSLDIDVALTDDMRVVRNGATYEIRGSVETGASPDGDHHQILRLRRVVG
jgi:hypothetical protein